MMSEYERHFDAMEDARGRMAFERDQARTIVRQEAEIERLKARIAQWREAYEAVYGAISWGDAYPIKLMDELRPGAEVTA